MSQIASAALSRLAGVLGIPRLGSDSQDLEDRAVTPVLDIGNLAAYGMGAGFQGGYFFGEQKITRTGAGGTTTTSQDPYVVSGKNGWPTIGIPAASLPPDLSLWLLSVNNLLQNTTDFTRLTCQQRMAEKNRGWQESFIGESAVTLETWNVLAFGGAANAISGNTFKKIGMLWPRGDLLEGVLQTGGVGTTNGSIISQWWVGPSGSKPPVMI